MVGLLAYFIPINEHLGLIVLASHYLHYITSEYTCTVRITSTLWLVLPGKELLS